MSSYTNVFGGNIINPTMLSYAAYTTAVDLDFVWQFEALDGSDVMAAKIDVTTSVASLSITFPKASLVSVGQDVLIRNVGVNTFTVLDFSGATLGTVASGKAWYFYLTGNSTDAGTWESVQFGTGTSSASATSLAGYGLNAVSSALNQNLPVTSFIANHTFALSECATVARNVTGAVTWTFPSAPVLGDGWFIYVINAGSGALTLTPTGGETIDGATTKVLLPEENCIVFCDGTSFNTIGYGRAITSTITSQSINIAGGTTTTTLTALQRAAQVQTYTGALTGNQIVQFGSGAGYWFVHNNTSGAYSVTFRTTNVDAGVIVPQGSYSIIRSNSANMTTAFTATTGTVTNVSTGAGLSGGPITSTGTIALAATAVTAGIYGGATNETVAFAVDAYGRLTAASEALIAMPLTQITAFDSATLRGRLLDETGTGLAVFDTSPTLVTPVLGVATATSINGNTIPVATDTVVLLAATQTLTNKTLTAPTINTGALGAASTASTQTAGDNSTKLATTAYVETAATNTAYVTMKAIAAFPFSFSYTPRRSTSILTIEVDIPAIGGQSTTNTLTVTVGASTLNTAFMQYTNVAYHASSFRVIGTYQVASAAALTIGSALTGGGALTGTGTIYMRVTESYGVIS
jgi:hypothetical protein